MTAMTKRLITLFHGIERYLDEHPKPEPDQHRVPRPLKQPEQPELSIARDLYEYLELESWKTQNSLPSIPGTKDPENRDFFPSWL